MPGPFSRLRRNSGDEPAPAEATEILPAGETTEVTVVREPAESEGSAAAGPSSAPVPVGSVVAEDPTAASGDPAAPPPAGEPGASERPDRDPGFLARGRLRRRLRYVRRAREVALRDLGGLVFDLHRFGRDRGDLVEQKLGALSVLDGEMRALADALDAPDDVTVLREPGLASCPRCGALRASDARFCSSCGLPLGKGAAMPTAPTTSGADPAADEHPPTATRWHLPAPQAEQAAPHPPEGATPPAPASSEAHEDSTPPTPGNAEPSPPEHAALEDERPATSQ